MRREKAFCTRRRGAFAAFAALAGALAVMVFVAPAVAEHTRFWRQSDYEEFDKGTAKGVAIRSDGTLALAPRFAPFADANLAYLWDLRMDSKGNVYASGGSNAKVVRLDPEGKASTVFESTELVAQAIALDKNDNLYIGTSPDGKVYKVTPGGQKSELFDPKTKYIWDLAIGADGTLYAATGDTGKIFAVAPDGKSDVFYAGEETHIRVLALDGKGNLLAGTEPDGLVLRIPLASRGGAAPPKAATSKAGADAPTGANDAGHPAYVVYQTSKREITALLPDGKGNLYVAAVGEKLRGAIAPAPAPAPPAANTGAQTPGLTITLNGGTASAPQQQNTISSFSPFPTLASTAVYKIAADDSPEEIWTSRDDLVYAMGLSASGKLLLGVGDQGAVMEVGGDGVFSRLAKTESEQVTGFVKAPSGKVYVATANPGKVFSLGPENEAEGTFESQAFDARIFSRWGQLTWWGDHASAANSGVELYVRAGNTSDPGANWSAWSGPYRDPKGAEAQSPAARFVQWKAVLHGGNTAAPTLSWVSLAYLPKNVAPRITAVAVQNPGIRVASFGAAQQAGPGAPAIPVQLRTPATTNEDNVMLAPRPPAEIPRFDAQPQGFVQKGYQGVLWSAEDANDDDLIYAIYYRGETEKDWKLLKDKLDQKFYSWDTTSMPDGAYYLKIVASDERSNPPGDAQTAERVSDRFVVDNTPPEISGVAAEPMTAGGDPSVTVRFLATDATSAIVRAQYSLDAGDWTLALPEHGLSDSLDERYAISLQGLTPGEHTLAVRVYDQFENVAAAKVTFSGPAAKR